jgi:hypothetical protein
MFDYVPMSEQELDKYGLLEGKFNFRVLQCESSFSNKGAPQLVLKLRVMDHDGKPVILTAYLSNNSQFMLRRLRHFCRSAGFMAEYEAKTISADLFLGAEGIVELGIEKGAPRTDSNGFYPDKTVILDFVGEGTGKKSTTEDAFNDKIPF